MKIPGRRAPVLLSQDRTANPVESKGSNPRERAMDLRKFLGLSHDVRKGCQNIRVRFTVQADASAEALRELCGYSPVFDIVLTTVPVFDFKREAVKGAHRHHQLCT
jgi:hypothetical protein